jgi:thiosulfate/3-mercaptopyruvate sulfurtransferase
VSAPTDPTSPASLLPGPLVDAAWLAAHAGEVAIVDVRWYPDGRSGRAAHEAGHIPGARYLDMDVDLSAAPSPEGGRHPLPDPEQFAVALGVAGVGDATPVVAYDDARGSLAARLWWMLRVLGHPVAVLDGGLAAWAGPLATGGEAAPAAAFTPRPWPPSRFLTADELATAVGQDGVLVVDARAAGRYEGTEASALDPRPGHVPGARSAPWMANVDAASGRFLANDQLAERWRDLGADQAERIVAYCGSGVTACHDLLALEVAGLGGRTALFTGSWSAWGADPTRPAAVGGDPGR